MSGLQRDEVAAAAFADAKVNEKSSLATESVRDEPLDEDHAGLIFPTEEEKKTLRRVPDSIPWNAYRKLPLQYSSF